jgi:hypothetical protein
MGNDGHGGHCTVAATGQWGHDDGATGGGFLLLLSVYFVI